jgi:hypothetical protein
MGDALGKAVDPQPWDPSVKALTAFPFSRLEIWIRTCPGLVNRALDAMTTVDSEGHNRIITPVFVPPLVQGPLLFL